jgi:hypothetical protein
MPIYQYTDTRNGSVVELEKSVANRDSVPKHLKRFTFPQRLAVFGTGESPSDPKLSSTSTIMKGYYKQEQKLGSRFKSNFSADQVKRAWSRKGD